MPKPTVDPRRLACEAGLPVIAIEFYEQRDDGMRRGFVRSLVYWHDDWNASPLGAYGPFMAKEEHRTCHVPAGLWFVAARAETVEICTIGSGEGAQECLCFMEVGDAWNEWERERASCAAERAA